MLCWFLTIFGYGMSIKKFVLNKKNGKWEAFRVWTGLRHFNKQVEWVKIVYGADILRIFVCAFNFNMYVKMHISRGKKSSCLKWTCRFSCNYYRVATLSKFYLTDSYVNENHWWKNLNTVSLFNTIKLKKWDAKM